MQPRQMLRDLRAEIQRSLSINVSVCVLVKYQFKLQTFASRTTLNQTKYSQISVNKKDISFPLRFFTWLPLIEAVISPREISPGHVCHRSCCRHPVRRTGGPGRAPGCA